MAIISAVIIIKNEEELIEGCLKSLSWVDEIVLVDSGSIDRTIEIAKRYTNNIYQSKWKGYSKQKNYAISKAKGSWILSIDADERVSKNLSREITSIISKDFPIEAYAIPRNNIFLGKLMLHGGWYPDLPVRLFKKKMAYFDIKKDIHENLIVKGRVGKLNNPIYHLSHRDIASNLLKTREYALIDSLEQYNNGTHKVTGTRLVASIISHFFNRYIRAKGYRDGMEGLLEALYQTFSQAFVVQAMLWERQRGKTSKEIYKEIDKRISEDNYE